MKPYCFISLLLVCSFVSVAQSNPEVEIVATSSVSTIDSALTLQRVKGFSLLPHQNFFYHKAYENSERFVPTSITIRNAVPLFILDSKMDSLKKDSYKLAEKVKDWFRLYHSKDMVMVNLVYSDKRRLGAGKTLYCVYGILKGKIKKVKEISMQDEPFSTIDSSVDSRLDSFALANNEYIYHDLTKHTITLCRIEEFKKPKSDESQVILKILFELLKDKFYKYYKIRVDYIDPKGLKLGQYVTYDIERENMFLYYDQYKAEYDTMYSQQKHN